jgi:predicted small integral membrane protein
MDIAWMAWTWQTALFFVMIAAILTIMTVLAARYPEADYHGVLGIPTTRGDRLFLSLLGSAFAHLGWIALRGVDTIFVLPIFGGLEVSSLWFATLISLAYAWAVFRWV